MIKIEKTCVSGWEAAIRGMRNPYDSWEKSDSFNMHETIDDYDVSTFVIGEGDIQLMEKLVKAGDCHAKFARYITVTADITAPFYWWKQFDTYKVGTVADSCSTMHTIMKRMLTREDFSVEGISPVFIDRFDTYINWMNEIICNYDHARARKMDESAKTYWDTLIKMLPENYNQKRTVLLNYQVLRNMYMWRRGHKLKEWHDFCEWIEDLPYSKIITTGIKEN